MKRQGNVARRILTILVLALMFMMLPSCAGKISDKDSSLVMVKNAGMSTYGTGFAVGIPGKAPDTIVTSYSVVATPNGAPPKTAEVLIDDSGKSRLANVYFYDEVRNFALLKLPAAESGLKPLLLRENVSNSEAVYVRGYDGTGNIMSDFESFNTTDIIQYAGKISMSDELRSVVVYKYSAEFNRALVGAPAMDADGNCIGMGAYSLESMDTYSQYILSSRELINCLSGNGVDYMTTDEAMYRTIITISVLVGAVSLCAIALFTILALGKKKKEKKENREKKKSVVRIYLRALGGTLSGREYLLGDMLSIGRDPSKCNVLFPVNEPGISGLHCTIYAKDGNVYIADNYSSYGTFIEDGTRINSTAPYRFDGGMVRFCVADAKNMFELTAREEIAE